MDLFAAVPVTDLQRAIEWFDRLLGAVDTFDPNDTERVWTLATHAHLYAVVAPDDAGHGRVTLFVDHLEDFLADAEKRGATPESEETYDNGIRKTIFRDPDGNEIGVGGGPDTGRG
ncbi:glyoxalase-like protein [Gordonia polyisoprenivorans VH2]|uniref:Glyoxalase-like protein n=1 Tax=Gordonia polyisoprenivorans (strain DSM 44266 / VH2) TaxID=1112204 RepID=H6MXL7_GORPV|nr:VOC family protein [Gordonia polyisoprenivorans]AFA75542.1 glyoxalase-like protein [Gordonia polyisoprenivorans VH2]